MVKNEDYIIIHYTGTFDNGEVFDSSLDGQPLEFRVGAGMIIPGLDRAVLGMKIDEVKDIAIEPEDAYGTYDDKLIHSIPLAEVKSSFDPKAGMNISVETGDGRYIPALIKEVSDTDVYIDLNHPLAGKRLHFNVRLVEINDEPKFNHGCSSCSDCSDEGCGC